MKAFSEENRVWPRRAVISIPPAVLMALSVGCGTDQERTSDPTGQEAGQTGSSESGLLAYVGDHPFQSRRASGTLSIRSDGTWSWREDGRDARSFGFWELDSDGSLVIELDSEERDDANRLHRKLSFCQREQRLGTTPQGPRRDRSPGSW